MMTVATLPAATLPMQVMLEISLHEKNLPVPSETSNPTLIDYRLKFGTSVRLRVIGLLAYLIW